MNKTTDSRVHSGSRVSAHPQPLRVLMAGDTGSGVSALVNWLCGGSARQDHPSSAFDRIGTPPASEEGGRDAPLLPFDQLAQSLAGDASCIDDRYGRTERFSYVVSDVPADGMRTGRMIARASNADLALVVIDAAAGLQAVARSDTLLLSQLGVPRVLLVVNKIDRVADPRRAFERAAADYRQFAHKLGFEQVSAVPSCALDGGNVVETSPATPWYVGPTLLEQLDAIAADRPPIIEQRSLRIVVQQVMESGEHRTAASGTLLGGSVRVGDPVRVLPSGRTSRIADVVAAEGASVDLTVFPSVTLSLSDPIAISPGDIVSSADAPAEVADQFEATLIWMGEHPMLRGRDYLMRIGSRTATATVLPLKYKIDAWSLERNASETLERGDIGVAELELDRPIAFDPYSVNRGTGSFVLIDRIDGRTVGAGMLHFALRRADNIHWQALEVNKDARRHLNGHGSAVVWLTGLSGSGKSTIANLLERRLHALGVRTYVLDGDNVRHGLNKDLGFTAADRVENIRRIAEVAKLMVDAGVIVITAFISPFRAERRMARDLVESSEFIEVFVDTPLAVAEQRDPKGLYKKARRGELKNFTGIDSPYEPPESPELRIDTSEATAELAAERLFEALRERGLLRALRVGGG